jgi:hypothetical protein
VAAASVDEVAGAQHLAPPNMMKMIGAIQVKLFSFHAKALLDFVENLQMVPPIRQNQAWLLL